ncbi:DUF3953 domain-containing protein [Ureibacillus suwonensis]|uniref:DUF3953 domain-containing protein n=1 Tax=Ureibacillus suwonensis TaxID=313007 RepID=A0ABW0RDV3_9BACL
MIRLKWLKILLALIVIGISSYGLVTNDYSYNFLSIFFLGVFFLILGFENLKNKKSQGVSIFSIIVSIFLFFVTCISFF